VWDNQSVTSALPASLVDQVRDALASRDLEAFGALLTDDVRWGDENHPRGCKNRAEVLKTFSRGLSEGLDGTVSELESGRNGILCRLAVTWPEDHPRADDVDIFHVYLVRDGHIFQILRFFDRDSAALAAGLNER
jgi:ketosteroid isomerase-like protein